MSNAGRIVLDVFSELQRARRGDPIRERQVYFDAIEQARLADQLGYGCWWTVEHHGATEFSYSSVPELVLTVLARETERIHLGHSGVLLRSGSTTRSASPSARRSRCDLEWPHGAGPRALGRKRVGRVRRRPDRSRAELREGAHRDPAHVDAGQLLLEERSAGDPERAVLPKPIQTPHPPLWQTCTSPESFKMAGELGVGVLATTLFTPLASLSTLFAEYRKGLARAMSPSAR
jgi:alkanesulfonate monooxygenase SsuD/methylene tetrahydromethanopterin reductase-like flavin-dependent oxidoreductase (luciferase family)